MITDIILLIFILLVSYTYLVYLILKKEIFKNMIILSSSIILFFILVFLGLINISGYPSSSNLPNQFNLLYVKIINEEIIILLKDIESDSYPRLHILKHSRSLEDELKKASLDLKNGVKTIGEIDTSISNNHYGITFRKSPNRNPRAFSFFKISQNIWTSCVLTKFTVCLIHDKKCVYKKKKK